jgi:protein TonB
MIALSQQEEKNKRIAMGVSLVAHLLLLLFLFYFLAWKAPDPPLDQLGGIEMSFGTTETGSGDVHSRAQPNPSENTEDSKPAATAPKVTPTPQPQPQPVKTATPEKVVTTTMESPVSVKEEPKPKVEEQPKEVVKKVDNRALMSGKAKDGAGNGTAGSSNRPTGNNNGDEGTVGDKGDPRGLMNGKKTGKGGSGGGSLNMPGWRYDIEPRPDPYENESGVVKFQVKIDAEGDIVSLKKVEGNVSPQVEKWYRDQIQRTTFSRISGSGASAGATGTITFIIRAN